ncbi:hypothetical protein KR059_003440 [Drosophila kikkawai]|nr:hypothetical protein KR059_003440 [Drosophila kikkawai]
MPKPSRKITLKPKIIRKKKVTFPKKVNKIEPQKQSVLKNLFVSQRSGNQKRSPASRRSPPSQQVWRRTVYRNKPKAKPKDKLPRLFRLDDQTGLPVDYEQTVERVMHYVNPHLASRPNTEQVMEELLTGMFMEVVRQSSPDPRCCRDEKALGCMCCRDHQTKRYLQSLLKAHPCRWNQFSNKDESQEPLKQSKLKANKDLSDFHSACKRGPRPISFKLGPTQASKFNFNQLRIKSQ